MAGGIYLVQGDDLVPMTEQPYDSEEILQKLLARHPQLLAGDQGEDAPRRWLLISREMAVPDVQDGAGRWSLDHLFVDQNGVPTLVEVKRSTDTRIRREVVGQMLDYAANAVVYWPVEAIQARFQATCQADGRDSDQSVLELLGPDGDPEGFWQDVKTNLKAGRIRLVFLADVIPTELQRIVEFLNGQMDPAEVLAVEVRQYIGQGQRAIAPRILGQTAEAQQRKATSTGSRPRGHWDEIRFFEVLQEKVGHREVAAARRIFLWSGDRGLRLSWGRGRDTGTCLPMIDHQGRAHHLITISTGGRVSLPFGWILTQPPFDDEARRLEYLRRLNQIQGMSIPAEGIAKYPGFSLAILTDDSAMQHFLDTLDWFVGEVTAQQPDM